jgi:hypothetical protein
VATPLGKEEFAFTKQDGEMRGFGNPTGDWLDDPELHCMILVPDVRLLLNRLKTYIFFNFDFSSLVMLIQ